MLLPSFAAPTDSLHHGIWRELMFSIRKSSTELNDASEPRWRFPSVLSPEAHAEWGLYKMLEYMGLHEILPPGAGKTHFGYKYAACQRGSVLFIALCNHAQSTHFGGINTRQTCK